MGSAYSVPQPPPPPQPRPQPAVPAVGAVVLELNPNVGVPPEVKREKFNQFRGTR